MDEEEKRQRDKEKRQKDRETKILKRRQTGKQALSLETERWRGKETERQMEVKVR
jgi:hypothetical protein